jgi:voltage-gated potassium channel
MSTSTHIWRGTVYDLLEGHKEGGEVSRLIRGIIVVLILLNGVAVIMESNEILYGQYFEWFNAFELMSVTIFTVEYFARIWVSAEKKKWDHLPDWRTRLAFIA